MTKTRLRVSFLILATIGMAHPAAAAAPASPAHLSALGTAPGAATVTWDASPGATSYQVYADVDPRLHSIAIDSKGNLYTTETYEGKRLQKFAYKGMATVPAMQGVVWPKKTTTE